MSDFKVHLQIQIQIHTNSSDQHKMDPIINRIFLTNVTNNYEINYNIIQFRMPSGFLLTLHQDKINKL